MLLKVSKPQNVYISMTEILFYQWIQYISQEEQQNLTSSSWSYVIVSAHKC